MDGTTQVPVQRGAGPHREDTGLGAGISKVAADIPAGEDMLRVGTLEGGIDLDEGVLVAMGPVLDLNVEHK